MKICKINKPTTRGQWHFSLFSFWAHFLNFFLCILFICLFYFWLRWVFVAAHGLSLAAASRGYSS